MIGKYSKADWSKDAPEGATHVGVHSNNIMFYKQDELFWWFWSDNSESWVISEDQYRSDYTLYSKDEDLKMKEVKSIKDLESGMFVKFADNSIEVALITHDMTHSQTTFNFIKNNNIMSNDFMYYHYKGLSYSPNSDYDIVSWSYTLKGEYTPVIKEPELTPEQLKINELEETIANASKQLEELKGLRNDNSNN